MIEEEKYELTWVGKENCKLEVKIPTNCKMIPCKEESVNFDTTENMFIEGDNLDALKLLQKDYSSKVKMIYIDPPYNIGVESVYNDRFTESNWLNMMYPRLALARELLTIDGTIFISINDKELSNLLKICDEIFGKNKFIATLIRKKRTGTGQSTTGISINHEYVVCYRKQKINKFLGLKRDYKKYKNPDNDPRGIWRSVNLTVPNTVNRRPSQYYDITDPATGLVYSGDSGRVWRYIKETMDKKIAEGKIIFPKDNKMKPHLKQFKVDAISNYIPISSLIEKYTGINAEGSLTLNRLFNGKRIFDFSKPVSLVKFLIRQLHLSDNDIVLDFFAGSCTTAHATLELNEEDNIKCKFIMIQLPEQIEKESEAFKARYKNVADIGKERIRRIGKIIKTKKPEYAGDLGFKVFKLISNVIT